MPVNLTDERAQRPQRSTTAADRFGASEVVFAASAAMLRTGHWRVPHRSGRASSQHVRARSPCAGGCQIARGSWPSNSAARCDNVVGSQYLCSNEPLAESAPLSISASMLGESAERTDQTLHLQHELSGYSPRGREPRKASVRGSRSDHPDWSWHLQTGRSRRSAVIPVSLSGTPSRLSGAARLWRRISAPASKAVSRQATWWCFCCRAACAGDDSQRIEFTCATWRRWRCL